MSSFRHHRSRSIDEELASDAAPGTDRSRRMRRVLGVLVVAVALPAAFAASPAAAADDARPPAGTQTSYADLGDCAKLMEAPVDGAKCETASAKDISGQRVERRVRDAGTRDGATGRNSGILIVVHIYMYCVGSGDDWQCFIDIYVDIYVFTWNRSLPAPDDPALLEMVGAAR
ncbi:MAG: hypothetical protein QOG94_1828 [Solirubrobacteraceae bacterium]|nr:hypothetical protein [Solirubrobacteraceae bacterium]